MARGGKIAYRHRTGKKVWVRKKGSDESDEDYMVGEEDEFDESDDGNFSFVFEDESEGSAKFEEEDNEEDLGKKNIKKVSRLRGKRGFQRRNSNGNAKPRKKKGTDSEEEEDHHDNNFSGATRRKKSRLSQKVEEDDGGDVQPWHGQENPRNKTRVSSAEKYADCSKKRRKKCRVSYREEQGDDDSDFNIKEEFAPDDEKELLVPRRNRVSRLKMRAATQIAKGQKRKRNSKVVKRTERKKPRTKQAIRSRNRPGKKFRDQNLISRKKKRIIRQHRGRRKKSTLNSDSDFSSSGSSDQDYTISEEEKEQVREATEFCRMLNSSLRSNKVLKFISKEEVAPSQIKLPGNKGKEKLGDMTIEVGKQVCGICLSDEGKRTVRGILNCCSHYFCFACIMEWSKVESRCPLCKQRFATISRTAQIEGKINLRDAVVPVPERDQVYQPSEEELRGYLDPYENVLCTECQQGGDDALMLLCDLCDSPAHTYCVGLGNEVPEGNWYCDGCKPTFLGSSNAQAMNPAPDHGADYNLSAVSSPGAIVRETFDLNELYVPDTPLTQVIGHSSSPRHSIRDFRVASPSSGSVAFTLYERRRIQRQIHQIFNYRSRHSDRSDGVTQVSGSSLSGSQIGQNGAMAPQQTVAPARIQQQNIYHQGRLPNYSNPLVNSRVAPSPRLSSLRGQIFDKEASASMDCSLNGLPCNEYVGINLMIGHGLRNQQFHHCSSRPSHGPDTSSSSRGPDTRPYQFREISRSPREKERVQSMVRSHLKSMSRNLEIGYSTFKHIARTSTHTILAAVGLEHRKNEVYPVCARPSGCDHFESRHTCPIRGQCSSCFDWFVRNVVREITYTLVSAMPMG